MYVYLYDNQHKIQRKKPQRLEFITLIKNLCEEKNVLMN